MIKVKILCNLNFGKCFNFDTLYSIYSSSKITSIHYIFFSFLATTLQPPLPTESSAEYNGDREFFKSFFHDIFPQKEFPLFASNIYFLDYCGISSTTTTNRIVGGESAEPHEFPWLVGK